MTKKTLVYINPDSFLDTDLTVLSHLAKVYNIVWFPIVHSRHNMRFSKGELMDYAKKHDIDFRYIEIKYRQRDFRNLLIYLTMMKEIKKLKADLLYTCYKQIYLLSAIKLLFPVRKVVYGFHDVEPHSGVRADWILITIKIATLWFPNLITFSKGQQKILKEKYKRDSEVLGLSFKFLGQPKQTLPCFSDEIKLLFFGSIIKYKGVDLLIQSIERLYEQGFTNIKVTIAGKGSHWQECEAFIKHRDLFYTEIRFIDNAEIPDLIASHHFLVQPYRDVTNSGPLMIAIAYAKPVIAPDMGCFSEILTNDTSVLYKQGNLDNALKRVSIMTKSEYDSLCANMQLIREANGEEKIAQKYIAYFERITKLTKVYVTR